MEKLNRPGCDRPHMVTDAQTAGSSTGSRTIPGLGRTKTYDLSKGRDRR